MKTNSDCEEFNQPYPLGAVSFGPFEVNFGSQDIRKHGIRIKLQEQPFRILAMLLEHPGQLVTREELRHKLWPMDTFVSFDGSLSTAMSKLRSALGDSPENPRYIETVPRRGYRWTAPVVNISPKNAGDSFL